MQCGSNLMFFHHVWSQHSLKVVKYRDSVVSATITVFNDKYNVPYEDINYFTVL